MSYQLTLNEALAVQRGARAANSDVYYLPHIDLTFNFIHEETGELWRVATKMFNYQLTRSHEITDEAVFYQKHLEAGQTLFMLLTAMDQMDIDPQIAFDYAVAKVFANSQRERAKRAALTAP